MSNLFLHAQTVIESLRDNGYSNTAYALGELIDNSLQAGASRVELGFIEEKSESGKKKNFTISEISIWDNGSGMSPETLRKALQFGEGEHRNDPDGMGRFGMGLPNSSISQCQRVDVWSWQDGQMPYFTYLDVNSMKDGNLEEVPEPIQQEIPDKLKKAFFTSLPASGTLVVWSKLDRLNWKTGKSIFTHCENLMGRMYRNFIHNDQIKIVSRTYRLSSEDTLDVWEEKEFRANDPMYLLKSTSLSELPNDYNGEAFFEEFDSEDIAIDYINDNGESVHGVVNIRSSIVKQSIASEILKCETKTLGHTDWGRHCAKNLGVSIVRAGRELVLRDSFLTQGLRESKGRFVGVEVSFSPGLDELFGVTNNKQDAVNLVPHDKAKISEDLGFELLSDYLQDLEENGDPLAHVFKITDAIQAQVKAVEKAVKCINIQPSTHQSVVGPDGNTAAGIATIGSGVREISHPTPDGNKPLNVEDVTGTLIEIGIPPQEAIATAENIVLNGYRYHIDSKAIDSEAFFDVSRKEGLTLVIFNTNHVFYSEFMAKLQDSERVVMETAMAGFARVMNEESQHSQKINYLNTIRRSWGKVVSEFVEGPSPEDDTDFA